MIKTFQKSKQSCYSLVRICFGHFCGVIIGKSRMFVIIDFICTIYTYIYSDLLHAVVNVSHDE